MEREHPTANRLPRAPGRSTGVEETSVKGAGSGTLEELARKSAHLQLLYDVAAELLTAAEIDGYIDTVFQRLAALIDVAAYFHFRTVKDKPGFLRLAGYSGVERAAISAIQEPEFGQAICGTAALDRAPMIVPSVQRSSDPRAQFIRSLGITAYACFPLVTAAEVYGTISFARKGTANFLPDELMLMRILADHIASALERTEAEKRVRVSEEQFRTVTESLPQLVWTCDNEGRMEFLNSQWTVYTGIAREELLGMKWRDCMEPADRERTCDYWMKALRGEVPYDLEYRLRRADGQYRWFKTRATPLRDADGQIAKWFGTCTDIHDHKLLEVKLRESEEWLRLLVGTVKDFALFSTDPNGIVTEWNPGAQNTFGYSAEEMVGQNFAVLFTPEDRAAGVPRHEQETAVREGSAIDERWHVRKNGEPFFASGVARPIRDDTGHLHGFLKVARDVTEWKEHEQNLERTVAERTSRLSDVVGELEAFSYSIVHDMRAPLRAMQSFARILEEECAPQISAEGKDYIRRIITAAERMDRLIQDVLSYSRVARAELALAPVDVGKLLRSILESYPNLQPPAVEVQLEGEFPVVMGNEAALTQCISNLLSNAAKFVAPGVQPRICVWSETEKDRARLFFRDNGIGIEKEAHEKIFAIFQRASRNYEGTGIGLAIVKKTIERMGGKVGLESQPGRGSTFWLEFLLPQNKPA
jgi:PAS domain S-box-containing protein